MSIESTAQAVVNKNSEDHLMRIAICYPVRARPMRSPQRH
jgi:hypothetical protein